MREKREEEKRVIEREGEGWEGRVVDGNEWACGRESREFEYVLDTPGGWRGLVRVAPRGE